MAKMQHTFHHETKFTPLTSLVEKLSKRHFCRKSMRPNSLQSRIIRIQHWRIQRGGSWGLQPPPLIFEKILVIRVAVVIYLVGTSSNNVYLCALNAVAIGYYSTAVKNRHCSNSLLFCSPWRGRLTNKLCSTFEQNSVCPPNGC